MLHRGPDRRHVGVGVGIQELQEETEVRRIPLVRDRSEQEQVGSGIPQQFSQDIACCLVCGRRPRHPVSLIDNHQVPVNLTKAREDLRAFGEVEGRDNMPVLKPLVNTELIPDVVALQHEEPLIEFLFELALPLKCQVRRAHDQHPISQPPQLQLMSDRRRFIGSLCRLGNEEYEES